MRVNEGAGEHSVTHSWMASRSAMLPLAMACKMASCSSWDRVRWEEIGRLARPAGEGSTPRSHGCPSISSSEARLAGSL